MVATGKEAMRGKWIHAPVETQPCSPDNTTEHVMAQVQTWRAAPTFGPLTLLIHPESAMEIAAWWGSPNANGMPFATFGSHGEITDGLAEAIRAEIGRTEETTYASLKSVTDNRNALRALLAYIKACEVTVWTVTRTDVTAAHPTPEILGGSMSEKTAREMMRDELTDALENHFPDNYPENDCGPYGQECDADDGELCARHSEQASIGAYARDGGDSYRMDLSDTGAATVLDFAITHEVQLYDA